MEVLISEWSDATPFKQNQRIIFMQMYRSDIAILCNHCGNLIHIKCNNLNKFDHEMLKSKADPQLCISCTSNILPFCYRHIEAKETIPTPKNLFHHNELFQLVKNLVILTL